MCRCNAGADRHAACDQMGCLPGLGGTDHSAVSGVGFTLVVAGQPDGRTDQLLQLFHGAEQYLGRRGIEL
ncbi:hypothetical protein D9M71_247190 [compost metagenome]